jgi:hypothetical protein
MKITVKELIEELKNQNQDLEIYFGGLEFYRLKDRGDCLQFEFNQTVSKDEKGLVIIVNNQTE